METPECPIDPRPLALGGQWAAVRETLRCILDDPEDVPTDVLAAAVLTESTDLRVEYEPELT